jgi:hypothetical protein
MERLLLVLDELEDYVFCLPLMWMRLRRALLLGALAAVVAGALLLEAPAATAGAALLLPLLLGLLLGSQPLYDPT